MKYCCRDALMMVFWRLLARCSGVAAMIGHDCRDGMERARGGGMYADVDDDAVPASTPTMEPSHGDCMRDGCPRDGCDLPSDIALRHAGEAIATCSHGCCNGSSVAAVDAAPASKPTMEPSNGVATEQSK